MKQKQIEQYLKRVMPKVLPGWTWEVEFTDVPLDTGDDLYAAEVHDPLGKHVTFRINNKARFDGKFFTEVEDFVRVPMTRLMMHEIAHILTHESLDHIYKEVGFLGGFTPHYVIEKITQTCEHFEEDMMDALAEALASLAEVEE